MKPGLLIDSHTGLSDKQFEEDFSEVLSRSRELLEIVIDNAVAGVGGEHFRSQQLAEQQDFVYFMTGIHPHDADKMPGDSPVREELRQLYAHPKCVAVGECGLDYHYMNSDRNSQMEVFEWHLREAMDHKLPLVVHTREAEKDTRDVLTSYAGPGMIHCFTASQDLADFALEKGFYLCFSGIVTFKKAQDLREVFLKTPLDRILLETDAPYLAPEPMRGRRNEPSFLWYTADFLAKLRGLSTEDFAEQVKQNNYDLFSSRLKKS